MLPHTDSSQMFASEEHVLDEFREICMETKKLTGVDPEVTLDDPESNLVA